MWQAAVDGRLDFVALRRPSLGPAGDLDRIADRDQRLACAVVEDLEAARDPHEAHAWVAVDGKAAGLLHFLRQAAFSIAHVRTSEKWAIPYTPEGALAMRRRLAGRSRDAAHRPQNKRQVRAELVAVHPAELSAHGQHPLLSVGCAEFGLAQRAIRPSAKPRCRIPTKDWQVPHGARQRRQLRAESVLAGGRHGATASLAAASAGFGSRRQPAAPRTRRSPDSWMTSSRMRSSK